MNNGSPTTFNNTSGTAVALDATDLQFAYDINNGSGNPGDVEMVDGDLDRQRRLHAPRRARRRRSARST